MKTIFRLLLCLIIPALFLNVDKILDIPGSVILGAGALLAIFAILFGSFVALKNQPRNDDDNLKWATRTLRRTMSYGCVGAGSLYIALSLSMKENFAEAMTGVNNFISQGYWLVVVWLGFITGLAFISRLMQNGNEHHRRVCGVGLFICGFFFAFWPLAIAGKEAFMKGQFHTVHEWSSFALVTFILAVAPLMAGRLIGKHSQMIA